MSAPVTLWSILPAGPGHVLLPFARVDPEHSDRFISSNFGIWLTPVGVFPVGTPPPMQDAEDVRQFTACLQTLLAMPLPDASTPTSTSI